MKTIFRSLAFAIGITVTGFSAFAQNAHEAMIKYNKQDENAVVAEYGYSKQIVEAALRERLNKEGLSKIRSSRGFLYCTGVVWPSVSNDKIDVYFRIEGSKKKSTLAVLVSKGYDNFVSTNNDSRTIENVKTFLNNFGEQVNAYQVALDVKAQEEAVKEAEARQKKVAEQQKKWEKEQSEKQKALDAEKQKLDKIRSKAS